MTLDQMGVNEWLLVAGAVLGPILAVQTQKWVERVSEKKRRKLFIFESLMATRNARISAEHARALNSIDFAFYGAPKVLSSWQEYRKHLSNDPNLLPPNQLSGWFGKGNELFVNLLVAMADECKLEFPKDELRNGHYAPIASFEREKQLEDINTQLLAVLTGGQAVKVLVENAGNQPAVQGTTQVIQPKGTGPNFPGL